MPDENNRVSDRWAVIRLTADKYLDPDWRPDWNLVEFDIDYAFDQIERNYMYSGGDHLLFPLKHGEPVLLDHDPLRRLDLEGLLFAAWEQARLECDTPEQAYENLREALDKLLHDAPNPEDPNLP